MGTDQLVEREAELETTASVLDSVAGGEGRAILVEGPAGIGKSVLLAAIREQAESRGFRVFAGRGSELETDFPFGVVRQLFEAQVVDEASRAVALADAAAPAEAVFDVMPAHAPDDDAGAEVSFSALHSLYWMALNLAGDEPTALFVDDLHWCDRPSLRFLAYLVHRLEGTSICLVTGLRSTDPGTDPALVADIVNNPSTVAVRPGPLSVDAVGIVVEARLEREADEQFRGACQRATGGNPLLLRQLLSALALEGTAPTAGDASAIADVGPRAVSRTVLLRLSRLPPEATEVARAVAILGDGTDVGALAELSGHDASGVARITGALARAEILRSGSPLGFVHPLVRDAIYQDIPPGERQLQHARAAELMRGMGAPTEKVAAQLLVAPPSGEAWVAEALSEAAVQAHNKGAPESAATYLARMLQEPLDDADRPEAELGLGVALVESNGQEAAEHLDAAYSSLRDPARRGLAAYVLARTWMFRGEPQRAARLAADAVESLPAELSDVKAMIEAVELCCLVFGAEVRDAAPRFEAFRRLPEGREAGESMLAAIAAFDWMVRDGSVDDVVPLARAALESEQMRVADNGLLWVTAIFTLVCADDPDAPGLWEPELVESHRRGSMFGVLSVHLWGGFTQLRLGELDEAETSLRAGIEQMQLWGLSTLTYAFAFLTITLLEMGKIDEARDALAQVEPTATGEDGMQFWRQAEIELLLAEGKPDEALTALDTYASLAGWRRNPVWSPHLSLRARALDMLGRSDEAVAALEEELELARRWGAPGTVGRTLSLLGTFERERGIAHLEEAIALQEQSLCRLDLAKSLAALGGALRRARKQTEAREPLRRAFEIAERSGAAGLAASIRSELHATGVRPRGSALKGPDALTASERRVADLAAQGQTNKQIAQTLYVTPKTVEVHLSSAYRKLEISSRGELAEALAEDA